MLVGAQPWAQPEAAPHPPNPSSLVLLPYSFTSKSAEKTCFGESS